MKIPKHPTLIKRFIKARLKKLIPRCPPLAATLGKTSGPYEGYHITFKQKGKTKTIYVPKDLKEEVESCIQEHKRIRKLLQEITQLTLAVIRSHVTYRRQRGKRA